MNNSDDRYSEHGLGHLLNPIDPKSEDRDWNAKTWLAIVRRALGLQTWPIGSEKRVAVGRVTISSPAVLKPMEGLNAGKPYVDQIKPFNFILSGHVRPLGHPIGADPEHFHLVAPYETDSRRWEKNAWIDQYSGKKYRVTTAGAHGSRSMARVKSYGEVLREYEFHPEAKCLDASGAVCGKQTVGLLRRRHILIGAMRFIGKESNLLDEVAKKAFVDSASAYTEYVDPKRDEWAIEILPIVKAVPLRKLINLSGLARSTLQAIRGGRRPQLRNRDILALIAQLANRAKGTKLSLFAAMVEASWTHRTIMASLEPRPGLVAKTRLSAIYEELQ